MRFASGLLTGEAVRSLTIRKKQVHRSPKIDAWVVIAFERSRLSRVRSAQA